jgi:hypothetical protein
MHRESPTMSADKITTVARLINLVIPGGGLILIGSEAIGVLIATLFTASADLAIAASLLFPDDFASTWRGLAIGVAIGTYIGAQVRYAQTVRCRGQRLAESRRHAALRDARVALAAGRVSDAWCALQPLADEAERDVALAYRWAQVLTAKGSGAAAQAAWRRVRRLDRHRIYYQEIAENERMLSNLDPPTSRSDCPESRPT